MKITQFLTLLSVVILTGCTHHHYHSCSSIPIVAPPIEPPPPPFTWQPPAWWNGTTGITCLVHHVARIPETVPIAYGLLMNGDPAYGKAQQQLFPNTWHYVAGGCCITPSSPKNEVIRFCPECRKIESEWVKQRRFEKIKKNTSTERYVVKKGDTLYGIARKFKDRDTFQGIVTRNNIQNNDKLTAGQILNIMPLQLMSEKEELQQARDLISQIHENMTFGEVAELLPLSESNNVGVMMHGGEWYDIPVGKYYCIKLRFSHTAVGKTYKDSVLNSPPTVNHRQDL